MISVQNLLRQLNGNSFLLLLFAMFMLGSCGSSKSTTKSKSTRISVPKAKKKKKKSKKVEVKKDPIDWNNSSGEDVDDKKTDSQVKDDPIQMEKSDSYNISLMIPFDVNKTNRDGRKGSQKFVNYYAGVNLALQDLEEEGVNLNLKVYDAADNLSTKLKDSFTQNADVIIGPYDTKDLKEVATLGLDKKKLIISPWKASKKITSNNPYYVQLSPNPSDFFKKIVDHVDRNFDADQVFLLGRDNSKDKNLQKYIQRYHRSSSKKKKYNEFLVEMDSLMLGETAYDSLFFMDRATVFIVPNYSSKDEDYVYNAVRRISTERGLNKVFIYGMPILLNSDRITFDYYRNLNIRTCRSKFVAPGDQNVEDFKTRYFHQFSDLPTKDAYEGYDMMMFVGKHLEKYGKNFQQHIDGQTIQSLQTVYRVESLDGDPGTGEETGIPPVNYYQNMHLDIIQFQQGRMRRIR